MPTVEADCPDDELLAVVPVVAAPTLAVVAVVPPEDDLAVVAVPLPVAVLDVLPSR